MKRKSYVAVCLVMLIASAGCAIAQEPRLFRSGEYEPFSFAPLKGNQHLSFEFVRNGGVTLKLFAASRTRSDTRAIGVWEGFSPLGYVVFTRDRQSCFFKDYSGGFSPTVTVWFLNGRQGTMTSLPNIGGNYMPTGDGKFIVYSLLGDPNKFGTIYLYDVVKKRVVKTFSWPIDFPLGAQLRYIREGNSNKIIVAMIQEQGWLAQGIIDPGQGTLKIQWDRSESGGMKINENKFTDNDIVHIWNHDTAMKAP